MKLFLSLLAAGLLLTTSVFSQSDILKKCLDDCQYSTAISLADKRIAEDSGDVEALNTKALALAALFRTREAVDILVQLYRMDTTSEYIVRELYNVHKGAGNNRDAAEYCKLLMQMDPDNIFYKMQLSNLYILTKEYRNAILLLNQMYKKDSASFFVNKQLAICYDELSVYDSSVMFYYNAFQIFPDPVVTNRMINFLFRNEKYRFAMGMAMNYLQKDSTFLPIRKQLAYAYYKDEDYIMSIDEFYRCMREGDSSLFSSKYCGLAHYKLGQYDSAAIFLQPVVMADSADPYFCFYYGVSLYRSSPDKVDPGIQWMERAESLLMPPARFLSMIYKEMGGAYEEKRCPDTALNFYLKSLQQNQGDNYVRFKIALLFDHEIKKPKEALRFYRDFLANYDSTTAAAFIPKEKTKTGDDIHSIEFTTSYLQYANDRIAILTGKKSRIH